MAKPHAKDPPPRSSPVGIALKYLCVPLLPLLAYGYGRAACDAVASGSLASPRVRAILAGAVAFGLVWFALRAGSRMRSHVDFFATLEHEVTHLIVGLAFLKAPRALRATAREGGEVHLGGHNVLIGLAPYFLPTLALLVLPFPAIVLESVRPAADFVIGAAVAYHVLSTVVELSVSQPDIRRAGYLFSALFLPTACLVCYGMFAAYAASGYGAIPTFFTSGFSYAVAALRPLTRMFF